MTEAGPVVRTRRTALVQLAFLLTGDRDAAEDVVQDALTEYVARGLRLDEGAEVAYLRRAVTNRARSRGRKVSVQRRLLPMLVERAPVDAGPEARLDLADLVERLPFRRRACVVLRYFAGLPEAEVAAILGVSTGTVKSQTHKALRQLREAWIRSDADD